MALDMLCQEMHEEAWLLGCRCQKSPLSQYAEAVLFTLDGL